jgi:TPR repeat protein
MSLKYSIAGLILAISVPLAALAHGPKALPEDPELLNRYKAGYAAYQQSDYATALKEWRPLAEKGNSAPQLFIGFMYDNGQGVARDDSVAADWYRKSAERDNMIAQVRLAIMYRDGRGVAEDRVKAWFWAGMAARKEDHMHRIGKALQRDLKAVMTPEELAEAEELLRAQAKKHE